MEMFASAVGSWSGRAKLDACWEHFRNADIFHIIECLDGDSVANIAADLVLLQDGFADFKLVGLEDDVCRLSGLLSWYGFRLSRFPVG